jgi:hypothetical protein
MHPDTHWIEGWLRPGATPGVMERERNPKKYESNANVGDFAITNERACRSLKTMRQTPVAATHLKNSSLLQFHLSMQEQEHLSCGGS